MPPLPLRAAVASAGDTLVIPVPGLDYSIGVASIGVVADVNISGNADNLTLGIDINLCATVLGEWAPSAVIDLDPYIN